ncbi:MAG: hypothetical protein RJB65_513 [Actinomycetota bacterium]
MEPTTLPADESTAGREPRLPGLVVAAMASIGAGAVHGAATGIHAEHPRLAQIFVILTVLQLGAGLWALVRPHRLAAVAVALVNVGAVAGWLATRLSGISWIEGLEMREAVQFADGACALLGAVAVAGAGSSLLVGWRPSPRPRLAYSALAVTALAVPAMWTGGTHVHSHSDTASADHAHDDTTGTDHAAGIDHATGTDHAAGTDHPHDTVAPGTVTWPQPWDPATGLTLDLATVPGVTAEQAARAAALIEKTQVELPRWSTVEQAIADGYSSIGDAGTGSEHYIKTSLIGDDVMLDPTQPESLVYTVKGEERILAGAMFIASARPSDDPSLTEWAGPLMTWHNHGDLCWSGGRVVGTVGDDGTCANGNNSGGEFPMVHVWITPHPCGPFAALEGVGAGQATVDDAARTDMCHDHGHSGTTAEPVPYDPTQPIDLSGTPGVTAEQQAAAENLIAITLWKLPQWADYRDAEAAGFHSIGDALTGHEHFIQWDWINDDVILDPNYPESLVYEPQPDGSKKLVSAMYMLPDTVALEDVPDIGGELMQWHIHDNLCFTSDPVAPTVAGVTTSGGTCPAPLTKFRPAPMIHVWIEAHPCGPFAALEGVGAGQILEGEERLCDHAHGSGF